MNARTGGRAGSPRSLVVLLYELGGVLDVTFLGSVLAGAFFLVPEGPLGTAFGVEHAGLADVAVADAPLLVEGVQLEELLVGRALLEVLDVFSGLVESAARSSS